MEDLHVFLEGRVILDLALGIDGLAQRGGADGADGDAEAFAVHVVRRRDAVTQLQHVRCHHLRAKHEGLLGVQEVRLGPRGGLPAQQHQRHGQQGEASPEERAERVGLAPRRADETGKLQHQSLLFCVTAVCSRTQSR
ncbi:hypothetical protein D9M70_537160 [compost metagenome]